MWAPVSGRDRGVMFRTTPHATAHVAPSGVTAACNWPYIDSPDWDPRR